MDLVHGPCGPYGRHSQGTRRNHRFRRFWWPERVARGTPVVGGPRRSWWRAGGVWWHWTRISQPTGGLAGGGERRVRVLGLGLGRGRGRGDARLHDGAD